MASNDPQFEQKAAAIIGLYTNPPQHAAVFWVDEKSAILALDRLDPVLPLSPGRAERRRFEYHRHGTRSLYAALDVKTGKVEGKKRPGGIPAPSLSSFSRTVTQGGQSQRDSHRARQLVSPQDESCAGVAGRTSEGSLPLTPTYSSWLNQIEIWFAKIERDVIARGVFTSTADLSRKLLKYIRAYAKAARPIRWTYTDPKRRIIAKQIAGTAH